MCKGADALGHLWLRNYLKSSYSMRTLRSWSKKNPALGIHMGSFPQPVHFFAAAQENEDIGALWKGPSIP